MVLPSVANRFAQTLASSVGTSGSTSDEVNASRCSCRIANDLRRNAWASAPKPPGMEFPSHVPSPLKNGNLKSSQLNLSVIYFVIMALVSITVKKHN